jgi:hypothetical protein
MNLNNLFESDFNKKSQQDVAEGGPYDLPGIDYPRPGDTPRKRPSSENNPYPYSQQQDDDHFRDIFRKKREAAKKAEQDKEQGVAESRMSDLDIEYEDYKTVSPREFYNMYKITKQQWLAKYKSMLPQQSMDEDVRLPYPVRSEKLGRANMELLIRAYNQPTGPRTTLSFGDRILELDRDDIDTIAQYYDNVLKDDTARWNFISGVMSDPDGLTNTLVKLGRRKSQTAQQPGLFQEANKKKDDEDLGTQIKDVGLQRAITRAKADFPTAGSGIEALAKDFMRSQDQDQKSFDQIRQAERKQDQMLSKINQIDQEQAQEIQGLEKQNSGLAQRLGQLQSVNSQLEKKLAAMSGRKLDKKPDTTDTTDTPSIPMSIPKDIKNTTNSKPTSTKKKNKPKKASTSQKAPAPLALPEPTAPSSMSSMTQQLTAQNPDVLEPVTGRSSAPRFNTSGAQDVVPRNVANNVKQNINTMGDAMVGDKLQQVANDELGNQQDWTQQVANDDIPRFGKKQAAENKEQKPERPEADYGDEYQSMVKRVGQKAKEGPRKTVWDPVKRVYKTVPVNK